MYIAYMFQSPKVTINVCRCDGVPDCHDSTDELSCPSSPSSPEVECDPTLEWRCSDGRGCIDVRRRCDGYPDCADLSDENELICPMSKCYLCFTEKVFTLCIFQWNATLIGNSNARIEKDASTNGGGATLIVIAPMDPTNKTALMVQDLIKFTVKCHLMYYFS